MQIDKMKLLVLGLGGGTLLYSTSYHVEVVANYTAPARGGKVQKKEIKLTSVAMINDRGNSTALEWDFQTEDEVLDEVEIWREKIARNVQTESRNNLICIKITNYWGRKNCLTESQDCSYLLIKPSGH